MNTVATPMYGWDSIPWKKFRRSVFKLQKRIYRAIVAEGIPSPLVRLTDVKRSRSRMTGNSHVLNRPILEKYAI